MKPNFVTLVVGRVNIRAQIDYALEGTKTSAVVSTETNVFGLVLEAITYYWLAQIIFLT